MATRKPPKQPRLKRIKLAALNIAAHPHPVGAYQKMLEAADRENIKIRYYGNKYAAVGDLRVVTKTIKDQVSGLDAEHALVVGNLKTFTNFDGKKNWINTASKKTADQAEQKAVEAALQDWRPEHVDIPFMFYLNKHLAVLDVTKFSIGHAEVVFSLLFNHEKVKGAITPAVNYVEVTPIPDEHTVERILAYPTLTYLKIVLTRVNGDDHGHLEKSFDESLRRYRAKKGIIELFAEPASSLEIDDYTATSAREAAINGFVEGKGLDTDGRPQASSTRQTPKVETIHYDEKEKNTESLLYEGMVKFSLGLP